MKLVYSYDPRALVNNRPPYRFEFPKVVNEDEFRPYLDFVAEVERWCLDHFGRSQGRHCMNWRMHRDNPTVAHEAVLIGDSAFAVEFRLRWC